ncbi:MAG: hypothetical protein ISS48_01980 [Candidatus Aenigmarchaeota archaeon]|nr:hypothetical protein [Candidatus Aenigmarchaeota archaeon]
MSIKGFKPYSHEATIVFIKDFYKSEFSKEYIHKFDHFRKLRNDSVYKAIHVTKGDAKSSLIFAKKFVKKVKKISETGAKL